MQSFCRFKIGLFEFLDRCMDEIVAFCRNIVLDVDGGEAIDEDEDQVFGGCFEPRHSVLRYRGSDIRCSFRHQHRRRHGPRCNQ